MHNRGSVSEYPWLYQILTQSNAAALIGSFFVFYTMGSHMMGSLHVLHGRGSSSWKCWHPHCFSVFWYQNPCIPPPPSTVWTIVLGSKTIRERFTHLIISNFLCFSRKLWSMQAMVIQAVQSIDSRIQYWSVFLSSKQGCPLGKSLPQTTTSTDCRLLLTVVGAAQILICRHDSSSSSIRSWNPHLFTQYASSFFCTLQSKGSTAMRRQRVREAQCVFAPELRSHASNTTLTLPKLVQEEGREWKEMWATREERHDPGSRREEQKAQPKAHSDSTKTQYLQYQPAPKTTVLSWYNFLPFVSGNTWGFMVI